jgi:hypothetical protein
MKLNGEDIPEKQKRGRPKGAPGGKAKGGNNTVIIDDLIAPYKIWVDTNQYNVVDLNKKRETDLLEKSYGYYNSLGSALKSIVKLKIVNNKEYTLKEYINQYETMLNEFKKKFEI